MAGAKIALGTTLGELQQNTTGSAEVVTPITEIEAGFVQLSGEVDSGTITASRLVRALDVDNDYRLRVGGSIKMLSETFPGSAINTTLWGQATSTMTITVSAGHINLNATAATGASNAARAQTYMFYPMAGLSTFWFQCRAQFNQAPIALNIMEFGMGLATGTSDPTDGVFFRANGASNFTGVVNFNGTETLTAAIDFPTLVGNNTERLFGILITEKRVEFWIDYILVGTVTLPAAQPTATASQSLPVLLRCYNSAGTAGATPIMKVGQPVITVDGLDVGVDAGAICGLAGLNGSQGTTGNTLGTTANYANSANPVAAVPTNTTAALGTGLGGQFWETDTLAVTTDGIICSYANVAGTAAIPGHTLLIYSVTVNSYVQTVLGAGGYVAQWSLAYGHTSVSLATAEGAGTKAPRRVPMGVQTVASLAAVNTVLSTVSVNFGDNPIAVNPLEFFAVVKKKVGTASASGVIAHVITVVSRWV